MEDKYIKEKSRYVYIRERAKTLKEKPKTVSLTLKRMAIQEARQQATQSRQEENSYAVDEVENSTAYIADTGGQALKRASREFAVKVIYRQESAAGNTSPEETYFKEGRQQNTEALSLNTSLLHTEAQKNASLQETHLGAAPKGRKHSTHSPQKATPVPLGKAAKNASLQETHFNQTYKEQGKLLAKGKMIKQIRAKAERKAAFTAKLKRAIERSVKESGESFLLLGGAVLTALIPLLVVLGIVSSVFTVDVDKAPVSDEVKAYAGLIQIYAVEHGIPEYGELIMAVMMQESGGRGDDPMQSSECAFNTEYPNHPNGITDPEYSINVGIQALADVLSLAGVTDIEDRDNLYIALQAYNFGPGYISYANNNGGHSELVALAFSKMMAERMGWESYGDLYYVQHVMRYFISPQD